jgi:hypothetical protein
MTTEKQVVANRKNALVSTGPVTGEGKVIAAQNAVKHGIFTKDLIIACGDGKESEEEYLELFCNLIDSLNPQGQMEHLLVEKMAVDFWRLRRVLRFETGSIRKYLDMLIYNYYHKTDHRGDKEHKTNAEIDQEIKGEQESVKWNDHYIKCLKKGIVVFDKTTWAGEGLECDIEADLCMVLERVGEKILNEKTYAAYEEGNLSFDDMKQALFKNGYGSKEIAEILITCLEEQTEGYTQKILELEHEKINNALAEEVNKHISSLPDAASAEKVMRYEKSIQKSILQNLIVLKKMQAVF